ncbi:hypothetical protein, partial [Achromobacter sp. GbtcB20]|uniref:hypothetical protein n=1 Tax=Achromobacter sp. GbtcB20 TaxID=2824765 RepID=UPI001C2F3976
IEQLQLAQGIGAFGFLLRGRDGVGHGIPWQAEPGDGSNDENDDKHHPVRQISNGQQKFHEELRIGREWETMWYVLWLPASSNSINFLFPTVKYPRLVFLLERMLVMSAPSSDALDDPILTT